MAALLAALAIAPAPAAAGPGTEPDPAPAALLHLEHRGGELLAWADNLLAGPVEVMLRADPGAAPVDAQPALPARATVPPRGRTLVARIAAPAEPAGCLRAA